MLCQIGEPRTQNAVRSGRVKATVRRFILITLLSCSFCTAAHAQSTEAEAESAPSEVADKPRWTRETLGGLQLNHTLAGNKTNVGYLWPLFPDSNALLLKKTHLKAGFLNTLSPVVNTLGAYVEAHPVRLLVWRLSVEGVSIIPLTGSMDSTTDPTLAFDQKSRSQPARDRARYGTVGLEAASDLTFQVALAGVALRNTTSLRYHWMRLKEDHRFFYYPLVDLMAENQGFSFQNNTEMVWMGTEGWLLGLRYSRVEMLYSADEGRPAGYGKSQQIGPLVAMQLPKSWSGAADWHLLVMSQWWLQHPNKMGLDAPQWLPAFAIGFATQK